MADSDNQELLERIEKLEKINKELKDEKTELKAKYKGVDVEEFISLKNEFDTLENEKAKLEKANKTLANDLEKSNSVIAEKDSNISKLLVDDGIVKALNTLQDHKLNDGALELATLAIKSKGVEIVDGVAMVGDKPMNEFISNDWLQDPASRNLVTEHPSSGGGANGGNGKSEVNKPQTTEEAITEMFQNN